MAACLAGNTPHHFEMRFWPFVVGELRVPSCRLSRACAAVERSFPRRTAACRTGRLTDIIRPFIRSVQHRLSRCAACHVIRLAHACRRQHELTMDVIVIGGGIVGVATAYQLRAAGHRVCVVERHATVAQGATYGHGGTMLPTALDV